MYVIWDLIKNSKEEGLACNIIIRFCLFFFFESLSSGPSSFSITSLVLYSQYEWSPSLVIASLFASFSFFFAISSSLSLSSSASSTSTSTPYFCFSSLLFLLFIYISNLCGPSFFSNTITCFVFSLYYDHLLCCHIITVATFFFLLLRVLVWIFAAASMRKIE